MEPAVLTLRYCQFANRHMMYQKSIKSTAVKYHFKLTNTLNVARLDQRSRFEDQVCMKAYIVLHKR